MNILFFIEPKIERNDPYFRLATIRNSLIPQIEAARAEGHSTFLVFGAHLLGRMIREGLESRVGDYGMVSDAQLSRIVPHHRAFASKGRRNDFTPDQRNLLNDIINSAIPDGFEPDLIVVWESAAEYLRTAFPKAKIVYELPGPFSRAPYPDCTLFLPNLLTDTMRRPRRGAHGNFDAVRRQLSRGGMIKPGITRRISVLREKFSQLILYPLQIDDYFMVDEVVAGYGNQFGAIEALLSQLPADIGLVTTLYKSRSVSTDTMTDGNVRYLRESYPNFILDDDLNSYDNVSQALTPLVDGVVVASSSVGFQAALWRKPLMTLGVSHLNLMSTAKTVDDLVSQVRSGSEIDRDAFLAHSISTYSLPTSSIKSQPDRFIRQLLDVAENDAEKLSKPADVLQAADFLIAGIRPEPPKRGTNSNGIDTTPFQGIREVARRRKVISFDIFDTLLVRPLAAPSDLFRLMHEFVEQTTGKRHINFVDVRRAAEKKAFKKAIDSGRREIMISEIYAEVAEFLDISQDVAEKIMREEERLEAKLLYPRRSISDLFHELRSDGKELHLISDMYLREETLSSVLKDNGISGYNSLLLSSTHNAKKQSGALFDVYKASVAHPVDTMLHIGDNEIGDLKRPLEHGIKAAHLNRPWDTFKESWHYKRVWQKDDDRHSLALRSMLAVIANECYDNREAGEVECLFPRGRFDLGFAGFGPLLLSYSHWLLKRAKKDGIKRLFFLSRDGLIMKKAYDIVARYDEDAPESIYLLCSRRSANVAKLKDFDDIIDLLMVDISSMTIERLLEVRFGLSPASIMQAGVFPEYERVRHERINNESRTLAVPALKELEHLILDNARDERRDYVGYLDSVGFTDSTSKAIVDIGYAGTMQESLYELTDKRRPISGYYLVTFRPALDRCEKNGLPTAGFFGDFIDRHDTHLPFCRHVPVYESFFSNDEPSLQRIRATSDGRFISVFQPETPGEADRRVFSRQVHQGALNFVDRFASVFGEMQFQFDLEPMKSLRVLREYFARPTAQDAELMLGLVFEDNYGGGADKVILKSDRNSQVRSNWVQGEEILYSPKSTAAPQATKNAPGLKPLGWRKLFKKPLRPAVKALGNAKDLAKYDAHPAQFFDGLTSTKYRVIGQLFFGKPKYKKRK